ncbi:WbqC family protein [Microvirga roseola]|uniref:WbqC family protein n=1 Tax=Microvirga roseola TaxID=2883126 RepID=UPI001E4F50C7|nr:WbqC family protein [Microvirga roseola]
MSKSVAITQSNYIPWRGYFDLLRSVDHVVLLECVQYTRRDWRNRNRIKTANGPLWLTIPVEVKGRYGQAIDETLIANAEWVEGHIRSIQLAYQRAAYFDAVSPWLFSLLRSAADDPLLTKVNEHLIRGLCRSLDIATPIARCTDILERDASRAMNATDRLLKICLETGATQYVSGPAARSYLDVSIFERNGIEVCWMDYSGYPEYPQLWGAFEPSLSIVDLLLNTGPNARSFLERNPQ